jgi:hypothetical protein
MHQVQNLPNLVIFRPSLKPRLNPHCFATDLSRLILIPLFDLSVRRNKKRNFFNSLLRVTVNLQNHPGGVAVKLHVRYLSVSTPL